jgi:hypothetical protein
MANCQSHLPNQLFYSDDQFNVVVPFDSANEAASGTIEKMAEPGIPKLPKEARVTIFLERLRDASAATNATTAYRLVCETLNAVEDEHSSVPYNPSAWLDDGRLYPPQEDNARALSDGVTVYRHRGHKTFVAANGAIVIWDISSGTVVFSKRGQDGKSVPAAALT